MRVIVLLVFVALNICQSNIQCQTIFLSIGNNLEASSPPSWIRSKIGTFNPNVGIDDIAFHPNGKLYGVSAYTQTLYEINQSNAALTPVATLPEGPTGMIAAQNGLLYLAHDRLLTFDPGTSTITDLGKMNYQCAGDMIFLQGDLYMTSVSDGIIKVNIQNPGASTVWMPIPSTIQFYGMAADWSCLTGNSDVYLFGGVVYAVNMTQKSFQVLPDLILPASGASAISDYEESDPVQGLLDTIVIENPDCNETNGFIGLVLNAPDPDIRFSLDGVHWQADGAFNGLSPGIYHIYVQNGCQSAPYTIALPSTNATGFPGIMTLPAHCNSHDGEIQLINPPPDVEFKLNQSDWITSINSFDSLSAGIQVLAVRNSQGCLNVKEINIEKIDTIINLPIQGAGISCMDDKLELKADFSGNPAQITWLLNADTIGGSNQNPTVLNLDHPGIFTIKATGIDLNGCKYEGEVRDTVVNCLQIPNVFSPDGNGINDSFGPVHRGDKLDFQMQIYNRWGNLVFENNSGRLYWNGEEAGTPAPSDVYYYIIKTNTPGQTTLQGQLTLIR